MNATIPNTLLDLTFGNLRKAWRSVTRPASTALNVKPALPERDAAKVRTRITECLQAKGGVVSAKARAAALGETYLDLDDEGKQRFLKILARDFAIDREALNEAIAHYHGAETEDERLHQEESLRKVLRLPARNLLMQFNALPQGVKFLVDLRADLRRLADGDPQMGVLERDLKGLLSSWFDIGFLDLERLTWDAPATTLEKLIRYEAVHEITTWDDLKRRLDADDRRVYAFFHPRMPDEPLIFVQIALSSGLADNVQDVLAPDRPPMDPDRADTAIFYSISNTQVGLQGVNLGDFLIKRVVDALQRELPRLKTFATLSPIPGFVDYLRGIDADDGEDSALDNAEREALHEHFGHTSIARAVESPDWYFDETSAGLLRPIVLRLAARHLAVERRRGRAINPVANFHLSNGARIEQLNWLADTSEKGLRESAGVMVNYLYKLSDIEKNHEAYRESCDISMAPSVKALLNATA